MCPQPDPSVSVRLQFELFELFARRVVRVVGEHLAESRTLFREGSERDAARTCGEIREGEHRASGAVVHNREDGAITRVEVAALARPELGTLT